MTEDAETLRRSLARLEGHWTGTGTLHPNPWGSSGPTTGSWTFRVDASGHHLLHDLTELRETGDTFTGHGVMCVDPAAGEIVWFWFDSYGHPPLQPARGTWEGDRLVLRKRTPRGLGRSSFALDGCTLAYHVESQTHGQDTFTPVFSGRYERQ